MKIYLLFLSCYEPIFHLFFFIGGSRAIGRFKYFVAFQSEYSVLLSAVSSVRKKYKLYKNKLFQTKCNTQTVCIFLRYSDNLLRKLKHVVPKLGGADYKNQRVLRRSQLCPDNADLFIPR
jgi:hypothetical protein